MSQVRGASRTRVLWSRLLAGRGTSAIFPRAENRRKCRMWGAFHGAYKWRAEDERVREENRTEPQHIIHVPPMNTTCVCIPSTASRVGLATGVLITMALVLAYLFSTRS